MTSAPTANSCSAAISTDTCGRRKTAIQTRVISMLRLPSLIPQRSNDSFAAPIAVFESETQEFFATSAARHQPAILYAVAAMVVLSLILMSVVKIDRVVTSAGRLVPTRGTL